jgi:2-C-methyl-D-erythritol 4-phosphate cytidylyltransferase
LQQYIVIVAGGSGTRMGSSTPKQFLELSGLPILMHTIAKMKDALPDSKLILALPAQQIEQWNKLVNSHQFNVNYELVAGGQTRFHSVQNALQKVTTPGLVAIHDGVRPLVKTKVVKNCMEIAKEKGNCIPTLPMQESLRKVSSEKNQCVNREEFFVVQTPQCFSSDLILKAYDQDYKASFTDDASVVEAMGNSIFLCAGNKENIKITTPEDLVLAGHYLQTN